jgi:putative redox protein
MESISIIQRLEYIKMKDDKSYLEKIVLEILVPPSFPEKYHSVLIKVADQCAVKKTIMSPPKFEIKTTVR